MNIFNPVSTDHPIENGDCAIVFGVISTASGSQCICPQNTTQSQDGSKCCKYLFFSYNCKMTDEILF